MNPPANNMVSSRPYLVRAFNEWILDNQVTPYVVVDAAVPGVQVPMDYVANGQIVLNISPSAVQGLLIGNEALEFSARFGGVPMHVYIPMAGVLAIYAKENGQGMVFGSEPGMPPESRPVGVASVPADASSTERTAAEKKSSKPNLKVIK
ncbi:ClpXP protease specificity-enhancing factor [Mangrovitalea sediminis]|uniref:ClpXP protease specificity-enhancing factor n=1 Tax=Mangrovitalea sediminis TaxID=1982043 RepID=UPI0022284DDE|nr:ClpXP protease specificity-enhancing factor [Mangrovitalea sediminis]